MIHYVLGKGGGGKTIYCMGRFKTLESAVFFASLRDQSDQREVKGFKVVSLGDSIAEKCVVDIAAAYRENLDERKGFEQMMEHALKEALNSQKTTIFLDEFQLYCSDGIRDLICNSEQDFYIIHQFPEQLDREHFSAIWEKSSKKYLLDPYQPSGFYKL
ncbi:hypothetical protein IPJ72_02450 [Candidatus Peregrinibacteria bacterium]|nr:MAG: hypothetical protein IPJ72_02450 [Candidatus Peregrinibacteria bacterium]